MYAPLDPVLSHILSRLAKGTVVSGQILADELNISRVALWKRIDQLKMRGCTIESTRSGYRLIDDDLILPDPRADLPIFWEQNLGSTMDRAFELSNSGAKHGTIILAEQQNEGRGQGNHRWLSPLGGLYGSIILKAPLSSARFGSVIAEAASFLCIWFAAKGEDKLWFKWPNDLLSGNAKLGGLLLEAYGSPDKSKYLILGLGLNRETPAVSDKPAVGLLDLFDDPPKRRTIISALAEHLVQWTLKPYWDTERWTYWARCSKRHFTWIDSKKEKQSDICLGINEYGDLLGENHRIPYGEASNLEFLD